MEDFDRLLYVSGNYEVQRLKRGTWCIYLGGQEIKYECGSLIGSLKDDYQSLAFIDEEGSLHHDIARLNELGEPKMLEG